MVQPVPPGAARHGAGEEAVRQAEFAQGVREPVHAGGLALPDARSRKRTGGEEPGGPAEGDPSQGGARQVVDAPRAGLGPGERVGPQGPPERAVDAEAADQEAQHRRQQGHGEGAQVERGHLGVQPAGAQHR
ncbi:hypothetical protein LKL35_01270 [Streptomyces sp. ET3-23]|uniref:hypothetical protein n=1 Tax=Streptomyces sp. ET3-23 TaxID=2885643 RepID=UPI001D12D9F7|nr:hypothetical protein [Streptomyces sp. ET3-23]MCC2274079.1 hypothetical protein [Streptomyces sp. ET3-23]